MKKKFALCLLLSLTNSFFCQSVHQNIYNWDVLVNCNPDTVYAISFSKNKLEALPNDLIRYKNLEYLDVSKNKLSSLPSFIGDFQNLKHLDISKNEFLVFPVEICRLGNLMYLIANRNTFTSLPDCIKYCSNLEYLDLWDTPVSEFPLGFDNLAKLKKLDLSGIRFGPTFQQTLKQRLPNTEILFDPPCDCME